MGAGLAAQEVHAPGHRIAARGDRRHGDSRQDLAEIIGIRPPVAGRVQTRGVEEARKAYVQGCLKLLERGERLPNRVLLLLADELGWGVDDS